MSLRCSLLGHNYGEAEIEREREEQGSEVVVTVREFEECERCGDRKVVTENKEVTAIQSPAPDLESAESDAVADESTGRAASGEPDATGGRGAGSGPDAAGGRATGSSGAGGRPNASSGPSSTGGPNASAGAGANSGSTAGGPAAGTGRTGTSQPDVQMGADAEDDDAEIIGGSSDSESSSAASSDSSASPNSSSGASRTPGQSGGSGASGGAGVGGTDLDDGQSAADDDGVILDDDGDSGSSAAGGDADRTPGEWPDAETTHPAEADDGPGDWPAVGREDDDEGFDAGPAGGGSSDVEFGGGLNPESAPEVEDDESEEVEFVNADGDKLGTRDSGASEADFSSGISAGSDAPNLSGPAADPDVDAEFVCPECDYREPVSGSSLRAGDICPDCSRGYIAQE
ncbi:DUF7093 family protein [Halorussus lipolyticus]|uniref:DUF7093 family protein n=1 Tax=Halorussus lipolyticus TaxID=3034024 RepID=UPI0023E8CD7E|nr:hypothetical protein [Halorussus sp. DT80]